MSDEIVYIHQFGNGGDAREVFHSDPDCRILDKTRNVDDVPRSTLYDDMRECRVCSGDSAVARCSNPGETRRKLLDADPDIVGGDV